VRGGSLRHPAFSGPKMPAGAFPSPENAASPHLKTPLRRIFHGDIFSYQLI
jgi:hypothetical protein